MGFCLLFSIVLSLAFINKCFSSSLGTYRFSFLSWSDTYTYALSADGKKTPMAVLPITVFLLVTGSVWVLKLVLLHFDTAWSVCRSSMTPCKGNRVVPETCGSSLVMTDQGFWKGLWSSAVTSALGSAHSESMNKLLH